MFVNVAALFFVTYDIMRLFSVIDKKYLLKASGEIW
jgi:hypothetical protein